MILAENAELLGVKKIKLSAYSDARGFFEETYSASRYEGITPTFVQDNHSFSRKGTIRGMHFQKGKGQAKLISVVAGSILDVYVDIRKESKTFGQWGSAVLSADNHEQLFIPEGFAHGFAALCDAHVLYKVSTPFDSETECGFAYNDPDIGIEWTIKNPILSSRDREAPMLSEVLP